MLTGSWLHPCKLRSSRKTGLNSVLRLPVFGMKTELYEDHLETIVVNLILKS